MILDSNALNIFTDGSFYIKNRNGGLGFLFVFPDGLGMNPMEFSPFGYRKTTNNRMELMACCEALSESLKFEKKWQRIVIYTDSMYVYNNYNRAKFEWLPSGGLNNNGRPIDNYDLWKRLIKEIEKTKSIVDIKYVKAHFESKENKIADKLAKMSAKKASNNSKRFVSVRRKKTQEKVLIGSVPVIGQRIKIRIITSEYLRKGYYKNRYEVFSKSNEYFGCVDFIYSSFCLRAGHIYLVIFNEDKKFPQVKKILKEFLV